MKVVTHGNHTTVRTWRAERTGHRHEKERKKEKEKETHTKLVAREVAEYGGQNRPPGCLAQTAGKSREMVVVVMVVW